MKIAVIGGGTAGCMAAAHLTKHCPQFELYHIYDSRIPTIGVGEGTIVDFVHWIHDITGLTFDALQTRCRMTPKFGICFEHWGNRHSTFIHNFYPIGQGHAYHIAAAELVDLLKDYISAQSIDQKIIALDSDGHSVALKFEDGTDLVVDMAIDASGFPTALDHQHVPLSLIPTNAALIRQGVPIAHPRFTRSIARPHGWIFSIPLTNRTSFGYIFNRDRNSLEEITADFDSFVETEPTEIYPQARYLEFPNYTQTTFFDGALFRIGNAASFLEPLEATAIGAILVQLKTLCHWPLSYLAKVGQKVPLNPKNIESINKFLLKYIYKLSMFVSWHYACGSAYDTPFWQFARANFAQGIASFEDLEHLADFERYLSFGDRLSQLNIDHRQQSLSDNALKTGLLLEKLSRLQHFSQLDRLWQQENLAAAPQALTLTQDAPGVSGLFGQWTVLSFTEMGEGLGYFHASNHS